MEALGKVTMTLIVMILSPIATGFVFMKYWSWFISQTFNINQVTLLQSIGIMFFIGFLKMDLKEEKEDEKGDFIEKLLYRFAKVLVFCGFSLLFGWILLKIN